MRNGGGGGGGGGAGAEEAPPAQAEQASDGGVAVGGQDATAVVVSGEDHGAHDAAPVFRFEQDAEPAIQPVSALGVDLRICEAEDLLARRELEADMWRNMLVWMLARAESHNWRKQKAFYHMAGHAQRSMSKAIVKKSAEPAVEAPEEPAADFGPSPSGTATSNQTAFDSKQTAKRKQQLLMRTKQQTGSTELAIDDEEEDVGDLWGFGGGFE
jgi:hypothetical protein